MSEKNGNVEVTFKKNVDYFEFADGVYYTLDALKKKYDCGDSLIYKRAKEFDIERISILNVTCYKDDDRFAKIPHKNRVRNFGDTGVKSYAEVYNQLQVTLDMLEEQRKQLIDKESAHRKDTGRIVDAVEKNTGMLVEYLKEIKRNNSLLEDLLNYVTKEKKND